MEAIILAGGFGTRLRQVVPNLPKPMAPIAGRPFLEILLKNLSRKGFTSVIISLGYKAECIFEHFGSRFLNIKLAYTIEKDPLGTGGAIRLAMTKSTQENVFVLNGDTFLDFDAKKIQATWLIKRRPIVLATKVQDTVRFGRLILKEGKLINLSTKGLSGPGLINAGCYVLGRNDLDDFPLYQCFSIESDFLSKEVELSKADLIISAGTFIDIGVPEDYYIAETKLAAYL